MVLRALLLGWIRPAVQTPNRLFINSAFMDCLQPDAAGLAAAITASGAAIDGTGTLRFS
jgi:hypothetical protein